MTKLGKLMPLARTQINDLLAEIRDSSALSEKDFVEKCLRDIMGGWIPVEHYLKMYPTESLNKIHKRVQQKTWQRQVHYVAPKGSTAWVNLVAIRAWLEGLLAADEAARTRTE